MNRPSHFFWSTVFVVVSAGIVANSAIADNPKPADNSKSAGKVESDIPYVDGGTERQKLDLYLPEKKPFATIVFTYGGGWRAGSRKNVAIIGRTFSGLGFACALLDHRSGTTDKFPAQIEDVAAGFAWVKKHIAGKGGDPKQVYVMGHSSGGHLSVLLATDPKYLAKYRLAPSDIAGVVGLSPIVDLVPRDDGKGFGNQAMNNPVGDVFSRDKAVMKDASPIQHISKDLPRTLLIVGDKDFPMLEGDAKVFVEKAKAAKATASLSVAENCNHLGVVQSLLNPKSPVMEQILDFLKASASKP